MNWLYIDIAKVLGDPAYVASDPVCRATWLNLTAYCARLENGGVIADAKHFTDRQWQQSAGVTLNEVLMSSPLLIWRGNDLHVAHYPVDKEEAYRAMRESGRRGGLKSGETRRGVDNRRDPSTVPGSLPSTDRIGDDRSRSDKKCAAARAGHSISIPESLNTPQFVAAWAEWLAYRAERRLPAYKLRSGTAQLAELASWGPAEAVAAINEAVRNNWQGLFKPKHPTAPHSFSAIQPKSAFAGSF